MLTRTWLYIANAMLLFALCGFVVLGGVVVDALAVPTALERTLEWITIGLAVTLFGWGTSYLRHRRESGDTIAVPEPRQPERLSMTVRVVAVILSAICALVSPLMIVGAFQIRDLEWLAMGVFGLVLAATFGYAGIVGRDPIIATLQRRRG